MEVVFHQIGNPKNSITAQKDAMILNLVRVVSGVSGGGRRKASVLEELAFIVSVISEDVEEFCEEDPRSSCLFVIARTLFCVPFLSQIPGSPGAAIMVPNGSVVGC